MAGLKVWNGLVPTPALAPATRCEQFCAAARSLCRERAVAQ